MDLQTIAMVLYLLTSFAIIGLIMLQQGKGAEAGASFGAGASATVFGSQGGGNFFSRLTAILATVFFILAFGLTLLAKQRSGVEDVPALVEQPSVEKQLQESDIPEIETKTMEDGSDVPVVENPGETDIPVMEETPAEGDAPVDDSAPDSNQEQQ